MIEFSCSEKGCRYNDRHFCRGKREIKIVTTCYVKIKNLWFHAHYDAEEGEMYLDTEEMRNLVKIHSVSLSDFDLKQQERLNATSQGFYLIQKARTQKTEFCKQMIQLRKSGLHNIPIVLYGKLPDEYPSTTLTFMSSDEVYCESCGTQKGIIPEKNLTSLILSEIEILETKMAIMRSLLNPC